LRLALKYLKALSWYRMDLFSYFFKDKTSQLEVGTNIWDAKEIAELKDMDYLVIYNNQWHRGVPAGLFQYLAGIQPDRSIRIKGIEYARVYNVIAFPSEKFESPNYKEWLSKRCEVR
jgi:hypothetical protein